MRIHFLNENGVRETHQVDLDLRPDHFLPSLDAAIAELKDHGNLDWFYRRGAVTLPHERSDDEALQEDTLGGLRQDLEIAVWSRAIPPHQLARERRGRVFRHLGKDRFRPY